MDSTHPQATSIYLDYGRWSGAFPKKSSQFIETMMVLNFSLASMECGSPHV